MRKRQATNEWLRGFGLCLLIAGSTQPQAVQLFRTPVSPLPQGKDEAMNCIELEREITALAPLTYSYKPGFYENPYQGGAILLGTTIAQAFYLYPVYDYYLDYREQARIIPAEDRMELLKRMKADKHCFES